MSNTKFVTTLLLGFLAYLWYAKNPQLIQYNTIISLKMTEFFNKGKL